MNYTAQPLCIERDRDALLRLWKETIVPPRTGYSALRRYEWFFNGNRFGPTRTWLLFENKTNQTVGCLSLLPRGSHLRGQTLKMGVAVDLAVETKHRTLGPALALQRTVISASRSAGFDFLIGCPNAKAAPSFERAGYKSIGDVHFWVKPIRSEYKLKQFIKQRWLMKSAGFVVDLALAAPNILSHFTKRIVFSDEIVAGADDRFDELWTTVKARYGTLGDKTASYLNWRYMEFEDSRYRYYCLLRRKDHTLVGYVVYTVANRKVCIVDLLCDAPKSLTLKSLLTGFSSRMKKQGHESIWLYYLGDPLFPEQLKACGFFDRGVSRKVFAACVNESVSADVQEQLLSGSNWFLFWGDLDI